MMNRPPILAILTAAIALASVSCIRDNSIERNGGGKDKEAVLSFNPQAGDHGKTRGATYDETWAEFANFFGGTASQQEDIFHAPDPNPDNHPDGWGRAADRRIATFRVLVYHATTDATLGFAAGDLVKNRGQYMNRLFEWSDDELDTTRKPPFELSVPRGTYDFVFVANENALNSVLALDPIDGSADPRIATLAEFKKLTFAHDTDIATDSGAIPMTGWYPGVVVSPDEIAYTEDGTAKTAATGHEGTWEVRLTRAAIRLSFGIHLGAAEYTAWRNYHAGDPAPMLYIDGLRNAGYVYPHPALDRNNGGTTFDMPAPEAIEASTVLSGTGTKPGKVRVNADGSADLFFDRLVFPEHQPAPVDKNSKEVGVTAYMRFDYGSRVVQKEIPVNAVNASGGLTDLGYSIPRNTWVWARAIVLTDVEPTVQVVPWGGGALSTFIDQWNLDVDRPELLFRAPASGSRVSLFTDHPNGWDAAVLSDGAGWITINSATTLHGNTRVPTEVTVSASANTGNQIRTGHITVTAGKLVRTLTVVQLPASGVLVDTPDPPATMYVGAFWRNDQFGERLIRVTRPANASMDGTWAAYVVEGDDWIVLDTAPSPDTGVWSPGARDPLTFTDFDTTHRVGGFATSVSGTVADFSPATTPRHLREIYFRIGLNGPRVPTAGQPAVRYGLILLVYTKQGTSAYQRIWVRQGQQADYLMRPEDANGPTGTPIVPGPGGEARPAARRFSPYNLTAEEFTNRGAAGAAGSTTPSVVIYPQVDESNYAGAFTDYPSQAGALFKWAHTEGVKALNPSATVSSTEFGSTSNSVTSAWDDVRFLYENCPPGYRRPSDGTTATTASNVVNNVSIDHSEMFQSLFLNARGGGQMSGEQSDTANSVWGSYADGLFDRKSTGTASVSTGNSAVAYRGRLFYNNDGLNSLFFPAAGDRSAGNGQPGTLESTGTTGYYWSSSASYLTGGNGQGTNSWLMALDNNMAVRFGAITRTNAVAIRCVEELAPEATLSVSPTLITLPHTGGSQNIGVASTSDDGFATRWEVVGYDLDPDDGVDNYELQHKPAWLNFAANGRGGLPDSPEAVAAGVAPSPGTVSPAGIDTALKNAAIKGANNDMGRVDLSKTWDSPRMYTANSYIVDAPGYYKLPLVYGNSIQNGSITTSAFTGPVSGTTTLRYFQNHNMVNITTAAIATTNNATLVWMDAPGLVNVRPDLFTEGGYQYLKFDVPAASITQGNAVIAVRNTTGTILWSWHIWVTNLVSPTRTGQATQTKSMTGYDDHTYEMMDYNVGWVEGHTTTYDARKVGVMIRQVEEPSRTATFVVEQEPATRIVRGYNPYYQWGRKDPIRPSNGGLAADGTTLVSGGLTIDKPVWWGVGYEQFETNYRATTLATLGVAIQNPQRIYMQESASTQANWTSSGIYANLWSSTNTQVASELNVLHYTPVSTKTIYDPSPVGFRVPVPDVFNRVSAATTGGGSIVNLGTASGATHTDPVTGDATFFPASGTREEDPLVANDHGTLRGVGLSALYWSALPHSTSVASGTRFSITAGSIITATPSPLRTAASVRPVVDANPVAPTPAYSPGGEYLFNGLVWAGTNLVDDQQFENPASPANPPIVFVWGYNEPHVLTNGPPSSVNPYTGITWSDNPCPYRWRVPSQAELTTLASRMVWGSGGATVTGATKISTQGGPTLFFPAVGFKSGKNGNPVNTNRGYYWSATQSGTMPAYLTFASGNTGSVTVTNDGSGNDLFKNSGMSIRCVRNP